MKKLRFFGLPFVLLALISIALFSAFTTEKKTDPEYYWFDDFGYTERYQTTELEILDTPCSNTGSEVCERGYTDEDLNVSGHPEEGLDENAEPDDFIMRE